MNQIIALLFPSAFGSLIYSKNRETNFFDKLLIYIINAYLTNLTIFIFLYDLYNFKKLNFTISFTIKYSLCASLISIIIGIIQTLISKTILLKIEVKNNEKTSKKSNKKSVKKSSKAN